MKERACFLVDDYIDRDRVCSGLAFAGYPTSVIVETDDVFYTKHYWIVVYEKPGESSPV